MSKKTSGKKLSRRDFLKIAGATAVAVPTAAGLGLLYTSRGEGEPPEVEDGTATEELDSGSSGEQPILVLVNNAGKNPFGAYLCEILLAEGVISFSAARLSEFDLDRLADYDTVLLTSGSLSPAEADRLSQYVYAGGNLIAFDPDAALLPMMGLKGQRQNNEQNFVVTNMKHKLAEGISTISLQYHGAAKNYLLDGAEAAMWFSDKSGEEKDYPAVTLNRYGTGWACAWAYDLVESIILTRQGNPAWANQERDGFSDVRPSDLFYGWIDLDRIEIPQADEQQRLLVNALHYMSDNKTPLPRLWYFPDQSKSMLIATSDTHQNPGWAVERVIEHTEKFGGHITVYSMPPFYAVPYRAVQKVRWWLEDLSVMDEAYWASPSRIANWRERGHGFSIHPLIENGYEEGWALNWERFTGVGYTPSPTVRVHRILWKGWVDAAALQERYGFRMNLDYYHVGDGFRKLDGEWAYGHFTGSGLPMKFINEKGRIIHLYQQLTHLADDHLLNLHWGGTVKIPAEEAVKVSKSMIDRSLNGGYAAIGAIFHTDPFAVGEVWATEEGKWMDGTLQYAAENNVPIWSAEMWNNFTEARHGAEIETIQWNDDDKTLKLTVEINGLESGQVCLLLPMDHSNLALSGVELNGQAVESDQRTVGSVRYAGILLSEETANIEAYFA